MGRVRDGSSTCADVADVPLPPANLAQTSNPASRQSMPEHENSTPQACPAEGNRGRPGDGLVPNEQDSSINLRFKPQTLKSIETFLG